MFFNHEQDEMTKNYFSGACRKTSNILKKLIMILQEVINFTTIKSLYTHTCIQID